MKARIMKRLTLLLWFIREVAITLNDNIVVFSTQQTVYKKAKSVGL